VSFILLLGADTVYSNYAFLSVKQVSNDIALDPKYILLPQYSRSRGAKYCEFVIILFICIPVALFVHGQLLTVC